MRYVGQHRYTLAMESGVLKENALDTTVLSFPLLTRCLSGILALAALALCNLVRWPSWTNLTGMGMQCSQTDMTRLDCLSFVCVNALSLVFFWGKEEGGLRPAGVVRVGN